MSKKKFKEKKEKKHKDERKSLRQEMLELFDQNPGRGYDFKQIARKISLKKKALNKDLFALLEELEEDGRIKQLPNGSFTSTKKPETLSGKVDHVNPRFAYIVTGIPGMKDIYVRTRDLGTAMHGDAVEVELFSKSTGENPEGEVVAVTQRARNRFVGRLELSRGFGFVVPDFKKIYQDFFIYPESLGKAVTNDKVVVEVVRWSEGDKNPEAKIVEILGKTGENEAEIHSIMAEFDLPFRFPPEVLMESAAIPEEISASEIKKRRDFRKILTFTIDPADAKDFDDAISFKKLENGNVEVGVHIADVTHYVRPGTLLDRDSFDRATSVYLVDRTVPMLPEKLSNALCSLRPHEDKLTFSAVFEMDRNANIIKEWFGRTVLLNEMAKMIRKERFRNGAVNFESAEVKFRLDEKGKPLEVIPKIRKDAHKLIEEYMLLANKAVATWVCKFSGEKEKKGLNTFVYRTHDYPDPEKVRDFANFARQFGHKIKTEDHLISKSLNSLMDEIEGKPEQNVLQQLAVRSMAKAKYTTEAIGHFGLAFAHYTHFTSPIRRYPDMMVHRLLQHYLDGGKPVNKKEFEDKCVHSSEREKRAANAERASIKYKQVEFMSMAQDKVYEAIITGVTDFGIFTEIIETKCEGMIRLMDLKDDFYEFDDRNFRVIGRRRKKVYRLGDQLKVRIKKTDIDRRLIDLTIES
jgi:ribonuclease R